MINCIVIFHTGVSPKHKTLCQFKWSVLVPTFLITGVTCSMTKCSFSMSIEEENSMTPENFQTEKLTANRRKESGFLEYFLLVKMIPQFQSVNLCQNYYDKSHSFLGFTWWLILLDGNLYQWWWSFEILCLVHKLT